MNKKHMALTIVISLSTVILQCMITLIITPLVASSVGMEAYGFVSLAKNFADYANILMIALNSYAIRYITVAYLKNDIKLFKRYYSTVYFANLVIGIVLFSFFLVLIFFIEKLINVPIELIKDVKILFLLTFASFFLTTISTVFVSFAYIKDKLEIYNLVKVIAYFFQFITLILCFNFFNFRVWFVGFALGFTSLTMLIGTYLMTKRFLPEAKATTNNFSVEAFATLIKNGLWNSINSLGNVLNSGLDLLITNILLTPLGMGQISVAKTISSVIMSLYSVFSMPFQPLLLKKYSERDEIGLIKILKESMQFCGMISNTIFSVFVAIGFSFLNLWVPNQDVDLIYTLCLLALLPCISEGCVYPLYYIYTLTVKNKIPCIITIIGGLLNILSMYVLIKYTNLGLFSVLITTAVIMNFVNLVTNPIYMTYCLSVKKFTFYPQIIRNVISCLVVTIIMNLIVVFLPSAHNWLLFGVDVLILSLIGILVQIPIQYKLKEIQPVLNNLRFFVLGLKS